MTWPSCDYWNIDIQRIIRECLIESDQDEAEIEGAIRMSIRWQSYPYPVLTATQKLPEGHVAKPRSADEAAAREQVVNQDC